MNFSQSDYQWMTRALQLAELGRYSVTPNPMVGCVLADQYGGFIAEGWHKQAGTPHAERHALQQAGNAAKGATAYVTLEPCSHTGRTSPCADALISAGVSKVICAMVDPNPLVAGQGLKKLRQAGIEVQSGLLEQTAQELNRGFVSRMTLGRPFITVKLAAGLDGKTALANGQSQWITGPAARQDVQLGRAASCAILTGSGTVRDDNPSMNVRLTELPQPYQWQSIKPRQPLRVIVDSANQLDPQAQIFQLDGDVLLANQRANKAAFQANVEQWHGPANSTGKLNLHELMLELGRRQINNLWVEAGAGLAGALLEAQLVDEFVLYQAPVLMGQQGQSLVNFAELQHMNDAIRLQWRDVRMVGNDIRLTLRPENQQVK